MSLEQILAEARERAERSGFMDRLRKRIKEDKPILDRLASAEDADGISGLRGGAALTRD